MSASRKTEKEVVSSGLPSVSEFLDAFIKAAGGMQGFCRELVKDFKKAQPGSPERIRIYTLILNLIQRQSEQEISDEEAEFLLQTVQKLVK